MGDRCFMSVVCRRQDASIFEELGFDLHHEDKPDTAVIEMWDAEANYAHSGDMPKDIPYYGHHYEGGDYGAHKFVCDGSVYAEAACGHNAGYVVLWDAKRNRPEPRSLRVIRAYRKRFAELRKKFPEFNTA
jgi:hypothetical protein